MRRTLAEFDYSPPTSINCADKRVASSAPTGILLRTRFDIPWCKQMNNVAADTSSSRAAFALLEIDDVSATLHVSRSLLAKWRMHGRGPRFMKVGRRILYEAGEVRRWLEAQERSSTLD